MTWYMGPVCSAPGGDEQQQQQEKKQNGADIRRCISHRWAGGEHLQQHHRVPNPKRSCLLQPRDRSNSSVC